MNDSDNVNALAVGALIQEFKVVRVLGAGTFGIVYLAENVYFPETVAIKEFLPNQLAQRVEGDTVVPNSSESQRAYQWALKKFVKEARILWELSQPERHPNIIRVSRFHEANGTAYMVMDFEEGESLDARLKRESTLPENALRAILFPLLDGLEKVHENSVWHRDIKPANILIRPDGSPVLIDFGAARWDVGNQDRSIMEVFTPDYAAPEQIYSKGKLGPWTDIYGLGATVYCAIQGRPPTSPSQRALGAEHVPASEATARGYDARFLEAVDAALTLDSEERPQNVAAWRGLLARGSQSASIGDAGKRILKPGTAARRGARATATSGEARSIAHRLFTPAVTVTIAAGLLMVVWAVFEWSGGSPGESRAIVPPDDVVIPQTPKPAPPDIPAVDPKLILARAQEIIDTVECASLSVTLTERRSLVLSGFVESSAALQKIRVPLSATNGVEGIDDANVEIHARPFCEILALLEREANLGSDASLAPWISLSKATGRYVDGERLKLTVTSTDVFDGYLYIDYVDNEGSIVHLLPADHRPSNAVSANQRVVIGEQREYQIAPPHGEGMIFAIVTRRPIFAQARPQVETAGEYLTALQERLRILSSSGDPAEVLSSYTFIITRPKS